MRTFSARETEWLQELDGIELAGFWPRAFAFILDWVFIVIVVSVVASAAAGLYLAVEHLRGKQISDGIGLLQNNIESADRGNGVITEKALGSHAKLTVKRLDRDELLKDASEVMNRVILPVLYFGTLLWLGKGRTPGKRIMKIRVVSLVHRHITFWHAVERALGYGAAALELGFGFIQFFIHPYRRCAQDRLAETIVVTERSYRTLQHKFDHPLIPDV